MNINSFTFKESAYTLLVFFNCLPYMQVNPLNTYKLDWEENLFDIYVESIEFRIKMLINIPSI